MLKQIIILLITISLVYSQTCQLIYCDECDFTMDPPQACITCHGWYEASWVTGLCVLSARLIIATIVCSLLAISFISCGIMKIKEYNSTKNSRPTNIESLDSETHITEAQMQNIKWNTSEKQLQSATTCNICSLNGGTVQLNCGHVFHGDCICWMLRKDDNCPACNTVQPHKCRQYCMKCLLNYLQIEIEWYPDLKKKKSRICKSCMTKQE